MPRVVFLAEAKADLAAISLFIAEHNVRRAKAFVKRLRDRCRILENHPTSGRPRPELGEGLRSLFERPYLVIYRHAGDEVVEVIAVVHAMRDLPAAMAARLKDE